MEKISVVITTVNRECVIDAIQTVQNQENVEVEIIVVIDGASQKINKLIGDKIKGAVTIINIPKKQGGNHARNEGISHAKYKMIALLDDDDRWKKDKLSIQVKKYKELSYEYTDVVLFSQMIMVENGKNTDVVPLTPYNKNIPIANYLFEKKYNGKFQTSTIFSSKETFLKEKFNENIPKHQDWDWAIQCYHRGFYFEQIYEPLTYYTVGDNGVGSSKNQSLMYDYEWLKKIEPIISSTAFNSYLIRFIFSALVLEKGTKLTKMKMALKIFNDNKIGLLSITALKGFSKVVLKSKNI